MKLKKRIFTMAICAVMAASSMMGMSASAACSESNLTVERIGTIDLLSSNPYLNGIYTNQSDPSSSIAINMNGNGLCLLENVYCEAENVYVRGNSDAFNIENNDEQGYFITTLNGNVLTRSGTSGSWGTQTFANVQIQGTLYAVKSWGNRILYYYIAIAENDSSHSQIFIKYN